MPTSVEGSQSTKSSTRRKHHHHHQHFKQEDLVMRRQKGSEVQLGEGFNKDPTEREEASMLYKADLEQMTSEWLNGSLVALCYLYFRRDKDKTRLSTNIGKAVGQMGWRTGSQRLESSCFFFVYCINPTLGNLESPIVKRCGSHRRSALWIYKAG